MIKINLLLEKFMFLSILLAVFDGLNIPSVGLLQSGFFYPTFLGIIILLLINKNNNMIMPDRGIKTIMTMLLLYVLVNFFINIDVILDSEYKGRIGISRWLSIYMVLIFVIMISIYYTYILTYKKNVISWVCKAMQYGFYIVFINAIIQFMAMLDISIMVNLENIIQSYINVQAERLGMLGDKIYRITGVSKEASTFGNYISIVFPWLIIGAFYLKKSRFLKFCCIFSVIFVILSYSRIAYVFFFIEIISIVFISNRFRKIIINVKMIIFLVILIGIIFTFMDIEYIGNQIMGVIFSFSDDASANRMSSNLTRLGLQYAALNMYIDNPILGVGLGQFQFHVVDYLPVWSYITTEIQGVMNAGDDKYFYGTFNTHFRVLAELGTIGFILWISIAILCLKNYVYVLRNINNEQKPIIKLIIISYVFSFLGFMNFDTYSFFYYWFFIALSSALKFKIKNNKDKTLMY